MYDGVIVVLACAIPLVTIYFVALYRDHRRNKKQPPTDAA